MEDVCKSQCAVDCTRSWLAQRNTCEDNDLVYSFAKFYHLPICQTLNRLQMVDAIQKIVIIVMGIVHVNVRNIFPSTEGVGLYRGSLFTSS